MTERNSRNAKDDKESEHGKLPAGNKRDSRDKDMNKQKGNK
ncbi:hypothetical protein PUG81_01465 [Erwiniaceae bacterium L1_54_6]|nr:hypothetical protein [Erwiniaceae bacterium L1_54_6]